MQSGRMDHEDTAHSLDFKEFLDRQQQHLDRRATKLMLLREELDAGLHQPSPMAPGSVRLLLEKAAHTHSFQACFAF